MTCNPLVRFGRRAADVPQRHGYLSGFRERTDPDAENKDARCRDAERHNWSVSRFSKLKVKLQTLEVRVVPQESVLRL
jgi:hypothetical protein